MKHKIKGLSSSRTTVSFRCDHCHGGLMASLREPGQPTDCPTCGVTIAVPGERELAEWTQRHADEERAANRSWSIDMAGTLIVAAIASLMAFIALPRLMQIERNSRATPAAPQESS
jgi:hypothetical protein